MSVQKFEKLTTQLKTNRSSTTPTSLNNWQTLFINDKELIKFMCKATYTKLIKLDK